MAWSGAFDSISLDALWHCLRGYGFDKEEVRILSSFVEDSWFRVALDVGTTADGGLFHTPSKASEQARAPHDEARIERGWR